MKARHVCGLLAMAGLVLATTATVFGRLPADGFPHPAHEGLFPLCAGCHADVTSADRTDRFPEAAVCVRCHDGERLEAVDWPFPPPRVSPLRFDHAEHAGALALADEPAPECAACHRTPGGTGRMDVAAAAPEACLGCHAHAAPSHLDTTASCATCHPPATALDELTLQRFEAYPEPADHREADFAETHGVEASATRCAVCHARPSCDRCHLNGSDLAVVDSLLPDARFEALVADRAPRYPTPADHDASAWAREHGAPAAADAAECANCHVRQGCRACHGSVPLAAVEAQPVRPPDDPRGVAMAPPRVHPPAYADQHRTDAAPGEEACASCHQTERFCTTCHAASTTPGFHAANFLERHGPEAYAAASDCASCHSTEIFCRSCHQGTGLAGTDAVGTAFHAARPFWLVGHGMAARQGLEGCVSCHQQGDCTRCHSARAGWRVSPHGPGFDPVRAREANPFSCLGCHLNGAIR